MSSSSGYNAWTVKELRDEAKRRGVTLSGLTRKQQIIDRILQDAESTHASAEEDNVAPLAPQPEAQPAISPAQRHDAPELVSTEQTAQPYIPGSHANDILPPQAVAAETGIFESLGDKVIEDGITQDFAGQRHERLQVGTTTQDAASPSPPPPQDIHPADQAQVSMEPAQDQDAMTTSTMAIAPSVEDVPPAEQVEPPIDSSPAPEDNRKRKRRSLTPAVNAEDVQKKLKHDEPAMERVAMDVVSRAPVDVGGQVDATIDLGAGISETGAVSGQEEIATATAKADEVEVTGESQAEAAQTMTMDQADEPASSQVLEQDTEAQDTAGAVEGAQVLATEPKPTQTTNNKDQRFKDLLSPTPASNGTYAVQPDGMEERSIAPAVHPATQALYIRNLMRPIQLPEFEAHLNTLATKPGEADRENHIIDFHVDHVRTHAFVSFTSLVAAARVRSALHECIWPQERNRQPLWVDFIPEEKVRDWIERERSDRDARTKRWEVVYDKKDEENVAVSLQEVSPAGAGRPQPVPFNAPTAPRSMLPPPPQVRRETSSAMQRKPDSAQFLALDTLFKSTTTKPKLYFQPVAQSIAERRLDELEAKTSRVLAGSGSAGADNRRYTWENDTLVDDGPEWGLRQDRGGPPRGGASFGRRGRGGYAGDAYRPRGDAYRPSERYDR